MSDSVRQDGGYVHVYRRVWANPVFRSAQEASVFVWMISMAAWKPGRMSSSFGPIDLGVGDLVISERMLSEQFGMHRNTIRNLLSRLERDGMITLIRDRISARAGTIARVLKYEEYQPSKDVSATYQDRKKTEARTEAGPQEDHKRTKIKEGKEGKEGKEEEVLTHLRPSADGPAPAEPAPDTGELFGTAKVTRLPVVDDTRAAVDAWNAMAAGCGLAQVGKLTDQRRINLRGRLRECGGMDGWHDAMKRVQESSFLRGETSRNGWKAGFDFVLQKSSFTKLMEGAYADSPRRPAPPPGKPLSAGEKLARDMGFGVPDTAASPDDPFTIDMQRFG